MSGFEKNRSSLERDAGPIFRQFDSAVDAIRSKKTIALGTVDSMNGTAWLSLKYNIDCASQSDGTNFGLPLRRMATAHARVLRSAQVRHGAVWQIGHGVFIWSTSAA